MSNIYALTITFEVLLKIYARSSMIAVTKSDFAQVAPQPE